MDTANLIRPAKPIREQGGGDASTETGTQDQDWQETEV